MTAPNHEKLEPVRQAVSTGSRPEEAQGLERLKLTIAYDGKPFRGWQSQATGDGVQDHLERAAAIVIGRKTPVHGSGRTDAGVHALGQTAHLDAPRGKFEPEKWVLALNANLPHEIRIVRAQRVSSKFHARFQTTGKIYAYRLWNGPWLHPMEIGRAWHVPAPLDHERLREGARVLEGRHDFAGFAANRGYPARETVRTIRRITLSGRGPLLTLRFEGDGFLYKMVRLLTGSMVRCAEGRAETVWLSEVLEHGVARKTKYLAPAHGLYLARVLY